MLVGVSLILLFRLVKGTANIQQKAIILKLNYLMYL